MRRYELRDEHRAAVDDPVLLLLLTAITLLTRWLWRQRLSWCCSFRSLLPMQPPMKVVLEFQRCE